MSRHKDLNWNLPDPITTWEQAQVSVLMDIRDELKRMNTLLHCRNFLDIPYKLDAIMANTRKPKRRRKRKVAK